MSDLTLSTIANVKTVESSCRYLIELSDITDSSTLPFQNISTSLALCCKSLELKLIFFFPLHPRLALSLSEFCRYNILHLKDVCVFDILYNIETGIQFRTPTSLKKGVVKIAVNHHIEFRYPLI